MPKGVEHPAASKSCDAATSVFHPLMPKGVEHVAIVAIMLTARPVFHPLMPKGVEHTGNPPTDRIENPRVSSVDAERR